jgi:hypothetical protein
MMTDLRERERKTFILHFSYSFIEGIIAGLIILNEFVFIKSLLGTNYQLAVLFQLSVAVFMLLIFMNEWLRRMVNKKGMLRTAALLSRLPLLILFFFPRNAEQLGGGTFYHVLFLLIFMAYYLGNTVIWPTINLFLKNTYRHENFSRLFSYSTIINKVVMLVTTFVYGWLLDRDPYIFVYIFPAAAVLGVTSVFLLSLIPYKAPAILHRTKGFWPSVKDSVKGMLGILRNNRAFFDYEAGFMLYGIGFMISYPLFVLFFEYELMLNYTSIAFYKNGYNMLAILLLPLFGKIMVKTDPRRFTSIPYFAMMMCVVFLALSRYFPFFTEFMGVKLYYMLIFYIIFHGFFNASMDLTWNIGSSWFCPPEEAGNYQSVHLVLTGLRSLFAPLIGIAMYEAWGFMATFIISVILLGSGVVYNQWSEKNVELPFDHLNKRLQANQD